MRRSYTPLLLLIGSAAFVACEGSDPVIPPAEIEIITLSAPDGMAGVAYSAIIEAEGGTEEGYQWALTGGSLPGGVDLRPDGTPSTRLRGTPQGAGSFTFTIEVKDTKGVSDTQDYTIEIAAEPPPLEIVTAELPNGGTDMAYSADITAANGSGEGYRWRLTDGELPPGLTLAAEGTPSTTLSGTLPRESAGTYNFTIEVRDSLNEALTRPYEISVVDNTVPLNFVTQDIPDGEEEQPYSVTVEIEGGKAPYSWRVQGGELPEGLELDVGSDGTTTMLAGTPTQRGTYTFQIEARDDDGESTRKTFFVEIVPAPPPIRITTIQVPPAEQGTPYSATISAINGSGMGYMWSVVTGALPAGLSLAATGTPDTMITGTPTAFGTFPFDVEVTDDRGNTNSVSYILVVQEEIIPISIVGANQTIVLANAEGGADYTATLTAQDGFGSYNWVVEEGMLPPGLVLQVPGTPSTTISGLAQALGTFTATVTVYDLNNDTASAVVQITVDPPSTLPTIQTPSLPDAPICAGYTQGISATGGSNSGYTWSVVSGTLPPGFVLSPTGTPAATIAGGTSNQTGTFTFTIRLTDTFGLTDEASYTVDVTNTPGGLRWMGYVGDTVVSNRNMVHISEVCGVTNPTSINVTVPNQPVNGDVEFDEFDVAFSPNGETMAYVGDVMTDNQADVFVVNLTTGVPSAPILVSGGLGFSGFRSATDLRYSRDGTKLGFRADVDISGAEQLYVVDLTNPAVPGPGRLVSQSFGSSSSEVFYMDFYFSPDGTKVAYIADEVSFDDRLYVVDISAMATGGMPTSPAIIEPGTIASFTDVNGNFRWTPDSRAIVFNADFNQSGNDEIWWVDVSGAPPYTPIVISGPMVTFGDARSAFEVDAFRYFDISPDGTRVAYIADQEVDNANEVYIVDISGTVPGPWQRAASQMPTNTRNTFGMKWSPDSTMIAHGGYYDVSFAEELYVIDVSGPLPSPRVKISNTPSNTTFEAAVDQLQDFEWSPDSTRIAYIGDLDIQSADELFVVDISGFPPYESTKVSPAATSGSNDIMHMQWSPDGTKLAFHGYPITPFVYEFFVSDTSGAVPTVGERLHPATFSSANDSQANTFWGGKWDWFWTADSSSVVYYGAFLTPGADEALITNVSGPPPYTAVRMHPQLTSSALDIFMMYSQGPYALNQRNLY